MKFPLQMEFKYLLISTLWLLIMSQILSCSDAGPKEKPFQSDVVAFVGDESITARQFQLNYEFGFAHLKQSAAKKASYLDLMIREVLLSQEGYRLGLEKSERVQDLEQRLSEKLMIEALFKKEVDEQIQITDEQIREAINKSQVRWKLRYWVEPTLDRARYVHQAMQDQGYEKYVQDVLTHNPEVTFQLKDLETDYLSWLDVPAELFEALRDLQIGALAEPIQQGNAYYIFQVTAIKSGALSEYDYQNTYQRYKQILFYRQLETETAAYISTFITTKEIITESQYLQLIENALIEWMQADDQDKSFLKSVQISDADHKHLWGLKQIMDKVLVHYDDQQFSVQDIVSRFDPATVTSARASRKQFHDQLQKQLTKTIRNYMFVQEALKQDLQKAPELIDQLKTWRDKWVFEEMRDTYASEITVDESECKTFFDKHRSEYITEAVPEPEYADFAVQVRLQLEQKHSQALLAEKLSALRKKYAVRINQNVLDTISVIDLKKSNWANLLVFDNNTKQMAIPVVDPSWGPTNAH